LQSPTETAKKKIAVDLLANESFALSAQVLQEFYVVATRKAEVPLTPAAALDWIEQLEVFPCADVSPALVKLGAVISQRYGISYCQSYGAVRALNPFKENPAAGGFHEGQRSYAGN